MADANELEMPAVQMDQVAVDNLTLDEERERHKQRAEKFGVPYRDPGQRREFKDEVRRQKVTAARSGFVTGFDLLTAEEQAKREQRAERFNMPSSGLQWQAPEPDEDIEKRKARAARFGVEYEAPDTTGLMEVDLYEERWDAPAEVDRRTEAVHVYGVDLLSTSDILRYFTDYGPSYVEWLNDSSCNVLFGDAPTAKRAIAGLGTPLPAEDLPDGVDAADPGAIEFLWHKGQDFVKAGSSIPLIFRTATVADVKPGERVKSRRLWVNAGGEGDGRGRGRRSFKVRRSAEGGQRRRRGPGWEHDDREGGGGEGEAAVGGEGGGATAPKGRGSRRFKRKSEGGYDVDMADVEGGEQRRRLSGVDAPPAVEAHPARERVKYDDL